MAGWFREARSFASRSKRPTLSLSEAKASGQDLHRNVAPEAGVGGTPDLTHAPGAEGRHDHVGSESGSGLEGQGTLDSGVSGRRPGEARPRARSGGRRRPDRSAGRAQEPADEERAIESAGRDLRTVGSRREDDAQASHSREKGETWCSQDEDDLLHAGGFFSAPHWRPPVSLWGPTWSSARPGR